IDTPDDSIQDCPLSIGAIGVAFHVNHHVVAVEEGSPAEQAGVSKDDNLVKMELLAPDDAKALGEPEGAIKIEFGEKDRDWPLAFWLMQQHPLRKVRLTVKAQGSTESRQVELTAAEAHNWFLPMRGFGLQPLSETRQAESIAAAAVLGFRHTRDAV